MASLNSPREIPRIPRRITRYIPREWPTPKIPIIAIETMCLQMAPATFSMRLMLACSGSKQSSWHGWPRKLAAGVDFVVARLSLGASNVRQVEELVLERLTLRHVGFHGLRVLSLESRRAAEIAKLIEKYRGVAFSAPAIREAPLAENQAALRFARELIAGNFDIVIFLTGVGARALHHVISEKLAPNTFLEALRRVKVAARGPKPLAILREWNVPVTVTAPEPSTWRELLRTLDELPGGLHAKRIVVQEYGISNKDFLDALKERGAIVESLTVYQWTLPNDTAPLRKAVSALTSGQVRVALFTTGVQVAHLFQIASEMGEQSKLRAAFREVLVASIGPSTSETLRNHGITVDLESTHPKMGVLVKEAAERSSSNTSTEVPSIDL